MPKLQVVLNDVWKQHWRVFDSRDSRRRPGYFASPKPSALIKMGVWISYPPRFWAYHPPRKSSAPRLDPFVHEVCMTHRLRCAVWLLAVFIGCSTPVTVLAQTAPVAKKKVASQNDLPRFNYPVKGPASALLSVDDATFAPFLAQVRTNLNLVLTGYDIQDRATLRQLTGLELSIEGLVGDNQVALATLATLRNLEDKPDTKLTTGLGMEAILKAR